MNEMVRKVNFIKKRDSDNETIFESMCKGYLYVVNERGSGRLMRVKNGSAKTTYEESYPLFRGKQDSFSLYM